MSEFPLFFLLATGNSKDTLDLICGLGEEKQETTQKNEKQVTQKN
jgi:hypothetical protein